MNIYELCRGVSKLGKVMDQSVTRAVSYGTSKVRALNSTRYFLLVPFTLTLYQFSLSFLSIQRVSYTEIMKTGKQVKLSQYGNIFIFIFNQTCLTWYLQGKSHVLSYFYLCCSDKICFEN